MKCFSSCSAGLARCRFPFLACMKPACGANLKLRIAAQSVRIAAGVHLWSGLGSFTNESDGNPLGRHCVRVGVAHLHGLLDDRFPRRAIASSPPSDIRSAEMAPIIGAGFKMFVSLLIVFPARLLGLAVKLPIKLVPGISSRCHPERTATTMCAR